MFYNPSPPRMFLSLDLLSEYRIQHGAIGPLNVTSSYSTWTFIGLHFFCILTYAIIYVLIHHINFWLYLYFLNIPYFFKYSCSNIFHRRSLCAFYSNRNLFHAYSSHSNTTVMSFLIIPLQPCSKLRIFFGTVPFNRHRCFKSDHIVLQESFH